MTTRSRLSCASIIVAAAVTSGCSACRQQTNGGAGAPPSLRLVKTSTLTEAQQKWGVAPPPQGRGVAYQPDVVRPEAGPGAIRAMSPNGLEWTIDGHLANAVQPGKILFATSRVAGRVLHVRPDGANLRVVLGPVELTDIYRELQVTMDQPVDFGEALRYDAAELPGSTATVGPREVRGLTSDTRVRLVNAMFYQPDASFRPVQRSSGRRFHATPMVGPTGLGVRVTSNEGDVHVTAQGVLYLAAPTLHLNIDISGGTLKTCTLELRGAAGLLMSIDVKSKAGVSGNFQHNEPSLPTDFSIPILMGEFSPFAINVRQAFIVNTGLGGPATMKSVGHFELGGSFRVGYKDGSLGVGGPTRVSMKTNPLDTLQGVSLGVTGLVLAHSVKVIVGVGAFGFATGPYVRLNSSLGISRDSDAVRIRQCRAARLSSSLGVGIGYVMPTVVTSVINFFLRSLNLEEIKGEGGIDSDPITIIQSDFVHPKLKACGAPEDEKPAGGQTSVGEGQAK